MRLERGGLLGRLSCSSLLGKKGRSGSSASSTDSATDVELYEYKGQEGSFSKDPPSEPPSWRSSPDAVRIKKRPSRNAQILENQRKLIELGLFDECARPHARRVEMDG